MKIAHGGNLFAICRERGWDWREVLEMSASINPLGPSPAVRPAIEAAIARIVHYPEKHAPVLAARLAEEWGVDAGQIILGNGATELIHFLARVWRQERVTLVTPAFSEFHRAWPDADLATGLPLTAGLTVLTQPKNPTGEAVAFACLRQWVKASEEPLLIDESFIEFTELESAVPLTRTRKNLVVLRSMTKFYALPGLRIGALVAHPDVAEELARCREPWQVNVLAEAAALAALNDRQHGAKARALIAEERAWLWERLLELSGIRPVPTTANFFLVYTSRARELCQYCLERKVILRDCTGWPGVEGGAVRFAIRTRAENGRLIGLWREFLCGE